MTTPTPTGPALDNRELHVLQRQADGIPLREIAAELHLTTGGVGNINRAITRKLGARNITNAVLLACQAGILDGRPRRHGDHAGYAAHLYRGEEPCAACWAGERAYRAERRRARKTRRNAA